MNKMQAIQIENPRGFDPELDMEPDMEPGMKDPVDKQGCTITVSIIGDHWANQQICLSIDTKFETTTLNLSREKAVMVAMMLNEKAKELSVSRETDNVTVLKDNEKL